MFNFNLHNNTIFHYNITHRYFVLHIHFNPKKKKKKHHFNAFCVNSAFLNKILHKYEKERNFLIALSIFYLPCFLNIAALAAASLAIGTLYGEQDT